MVDVRTGIRAEEVRTGGEHVLFVEGKEEESLDQAVLRALLGETIRVEAMGPSYSVRSAAQALARHHPKYYFLIDRDHHDDDFVEDCWRRFPDVGVDNLLVWRRREIENYFLEPPFLAQSSYCRASESELGGVLQRAAQERLYLDVANAVISSIREDQKTTWIRQFRNPADFRSIEDSLRHLMSASEFARRSRQVSAMVSGAEITRRFEERLQSMTGGEEHVALGTGRWLEMIRGKRVLARMLNSGGFVVEDREGRRVAGRDMTYVVLRELVVKDVDARPADLGELLTLIRSRVADGSD